MKVEEESSSRLQAAASEHGLTELSSVDRECVIQNFRYYEKQKGAPVERFELPMVLNSKFHTNLTSSLYSMRLQPDCDQDIAAQRLLRRQEDPKD